MGILRRMTKKRRAAKKRQNGGVIFMGAPVNYSVPPNQRQPSEAIMEWATTADNKNMLGGSRNFDNQYEEIQNMWLDIYNQVPGDVVSRNGVPLTAKIADTVKLLEEIYNNDLNLNRLKREKDSVEVKIYLYNINDDIENKISEANKKTIEFIELLEHYNPANNVAAHNAAAHNAAAHNAVAPFFPPNAANPRPFQPLPRPAYNGGYKRTHRNKRAHHNKRKGTHHNKRKGTHHNKRKGTHRNKRKGTHRNKRN
jgi:hypothetical protein